MPASQFELGAPVGRGGAKAVGGARRCSKLGVAACGIDELQAEQFLPPALEWLGRSIQNEMVP